MKKLNRLFLILITLLVLTGCEFLQSSLSSEIEKSVLEDSGIATISSANWYYNGTKDTNMKELTSLGSENYVASSVLVSFGKQVALKSENPVGTILINAKELITSSGVGAALGFGFGFTPQNVNFGVGIHGGLSVFLTGKPFPLGTEGYIKMSVNFPLAYGWKVFSTEKNRLDLGVNFHPEIAVIKGLNGSDVDALTGGSISIGKLVSDAVDNPYYSLPIDCGVIYSILGKPYSGAEIRIGFNAKNLFGNYFGPGDKLVPLEKQIVLNLGTGFYLPFEIFTVKSSCILSAELYDINQIFTGYSDFWKSLRLGAELNVGNVFCIRSGLTSGYPSIGAEVRILGFGVGFSWETVEKGLYIGDNPLSILRLAIQIY